MIKTNTQLVDPHYKIHSNQENAKRVFPGDDGKALKLEENFGMFSLHESADFRKNPGLFTPYLKDVNEGLDAISDLELLRWRGVYYLPKEDHVFADSEYGFLLKSNHDYIGIATFEAGKRMLLMTQIQALKASKLTKNLRIPEFFIHLFEGFGRENEVPEMAILPYLRNRWGNVREDSRKKTSYDRPAKRNMFTHDDLRGLWVKNLQQISENATPSLVSAVGSLE